MFRFVIDAGIRQCSRLRGSALRFATFAMAHHLKSSNRGCGDHIRISETNCAGMTVLAPDMGWSAQFQFLRFGPNVNTPIAHGTTIAPIGQLVI